MVARPCLRSLDKPIVALWGLEPVDLFAVVALVGVLMVLTNIGIAILVGLVGCLGLKALKAGKPRGYVFYLFYRTGLLRMAPEALRPPYLVIPPAPGSRTLHFSPAPGAGDDETPEARYWRGGKEFLT